MTTWICNECGAHFETETMPPDNCLICEDDRQFVPLSGQKWLSRQDLVSVTNSWQELEPGLISIGTTPSIGIGQRALLLLTPQGNVLWDCVPVLDRATKDRIDAIGGLKAIAVSHPHFYTGMTEWSNAFDNAPIFISALDKSFVTKSSPNIQYVTDDRYQIMPGVNLHHLGGHFPGSSVLEWQAGADRRGVIFSGDTIQVTAGNVHVSFMYSFPNLLPLPAREVARIADRIQPLKFDRLYGGWLEKFIDKNAKDIVLASAKRYLGALT